MHDLATRRAIVGVLAAASSALLTPGRAVEDSSEAMEAQLTQLLRLGGPAGVTLCVADTQAAELMIRQLELRGGSQLGAASGEGVWELPFVGGWDVLYAVPAFAGGPLATKTGSSLSVSSVREYVWGPGDGGVSTEVVYSASDGADKAIMLTRTGSVTNMPAADVRLDFPEPVSANSVTAAATMGSPVSLASLGFSSPAGGASLRTTTYLSETLWVTRSGDDGGLAVLRRTDVDALKPPSRKLYGKVYSLRYSD